MDELMQAWVETASTEEIKAEIVHLYKQMLLMENQYKAAVGKAWGILP